MDYRPLNPAKHEIRLLTILQVPGDSEIIQATLEHHSLDQPPRYTALSYCWGDPTVTQTIYIDKKPFEATINLVHALRQLRGNVTGQFWIDAVCINQKDIGEKNDQIGLMMRDIYRGAHSVVAWVGLENESNNDTTLIRGLHLLDFASERFPLPLTTSLITFLQRDFWARVWIIQEIALATRLIIHCGGERITWDKFETATMAIFEKEKAAADTGRLYYNVESLIYFRSLSIRYRDSRNNVNIPLLPALYKTWTAKATKEQDKIFGLLGLVTDGDQYINRPSYENSVEQVCQQLTIGVHRREKTLDVIPMLARGCSHPTVTSGRSPSWVPQWHALDGDAQKRQLDYLQGEKRYTAAGDLESSISRENDTLTCVGTLVGSIHMASSSLLPDHEQVSPAVHGPIPKLYSTSQEIFLAISNCLSISEDNSKYRGIFREDNITLSEILRIWRSPDYQAGFQDKTQEWINRHRSLIFHGRTLQDWAEWMTHTYKGKRIRALAVRKRHKGLESHVKYNVVPGLARRIEQGMRLITTSTGHIGWACADSKAGDLIYILKGCSVPVILRPAGANGELVIVGDAYIQDLMDGEFTHGLQESSWRDVAIH